MYKPYEEEEKKKQQQQDSQPNTTANATQSPETPKSTAPQYKPSTTVQTAQQNLATHTASKPTPYQSNWASQLDGLMSQIMNREKFSYDMNADALYQQAKDMYTNQANMGMQNAMAQASALTGGYGSSYGQMVGQQAYAQQMQGLNDMLPELYQNALNQYINEGNELYNHYNMVANQENLDYGRYRDSMNDYLAERDYLNSIYNTEAERDYNRYLDERNYTYQTDRDAILDARYEQEWAASEEQRLRDNAYQDKLFDWQIEEFNKMYGYTDENGVYHEGVVDREREDKQAHDKDMATEERNWQDQDREDRQTHDSDMAEQGHDWQVEEWEKMYGDEGFYTKQQKVQEEANNPYTTYEGDGLLTGQNVPKQLAGVQGLTTTNTNLFDDNGHFKQAAVVSGTYEEGESGIPEAGKGTMTYNIGGKEVTLKTGTSPYTNTVNPDAKNGVFSNGYQPDNIEGYKLEEGDTEALVNGQWVPTYTTEDGKSWYYDAANNTYEEILDDEEDKSEEKHKLNKSDEYIIGASGGGSNKKPTYIAHD